MPESPDRAKLILQKSMIVVLFVGFTAYIALAIGFAVYFLINAYFYQVGDFERAGLGALIAVIGTGLTAVASIYAANRQALAAHQVEILRGETSHELAKLTATLTGDLEAIKAQSARSLEKLKMHLDAEKNAYREISGAAATYFYSLRSVAMDKWNAKLLATAEDGMVAATRHLIYVDQEMRDTWMTFWQEAQLIYRAGREEAEEAKRASVIESEIMKRFRSPEGSLNLRDRYRQVEDMARQAIARERSTENVTAIT